MTPTKRISHGVELPSQTSGSRYLHEVLLRAVRRFPEALRGAAFPEDPQRFKQHYSTLLPSFEAFRVASAERAEIARFVCVEAEKGLRFVDDAGDAVFDDVLLRPAEPLALVQVKLDGPSRLVPEVPFEGQLLRGRDLGRWADDMISRGLMTSAAQQAFVRLLSRAGADDGSLSLRGERFALLGAAAELAPTELLLEAGADVLWIDTREPASERLVRARASGSLSFVKGGADLLAQPDRILATLRAFAEQGQKPIHVFMYAYAGGESQEWRLTTSMNAIVRALPREVVASVAMLISPTTPSQVSREDVELSRVRHRDAPMWKRTLERTGQLRPGQLGDPGAEVACAIVRAQGVSYQAAQLVGKIYAAEAYAVYGNTLREDVESPLAVSANVAPITATRSLSHPVFQAAFLGAPLFDILIARPETTRALAGLLTIHDVLERSAPVPASGERLAAATRAKQALAQQVHGGVYANPYALDGCITVAALRGLGKKPKLAAGLFRGARA